MYIEFILEEIQVPPRFVDGVVNRQPGFAAYRASKTAAAAEVHVYVQLSLGGFEFDFIYVKRLIYAQRRYE